jgi:DNA-directed RNA polymerase specialized sigma24 family protein
MLQHDYDRIRAEARRVCRNPGEADDLLQDALIEALRQDRADLSILANRRWLHGVIRNKARMAARTGQRRRLRDTAWQEDRRDPAVPEATPVSDLLAALPPALKSVAALALSGHSRREIAYLLRLDDTTLRQRIATLGKRIRALGLPVPENTPGLRLELHYGRIRDALLPALLREGGIFATHDPDGHLMIFRRHPTPDAHKSPVGGNLERKATVRSQP